MRGRDYLLMLDLHLHAMLLNRAKKAYNAVVGVRIIERVLVRMTLRLK